MRGTDAGKNYGKALLLFLVLFCVYYAGHKIIPVYMSNNQLEAYLRVQTLFWLDNRATRDAIRNDILAKAQDLNLPISRDQVQVEADFKRPPFRVFVSIDYTVPIDLKVYTLTLHFTPHSPHRHL
jgi:hypothetical protein